MSNYGALYNRYMNEANYYAEQFRLDPYSATNGEWDAFRHAYASAEMKREYGEAAAHAFGDLNEVKGDIINDQKYYKKNMEPRGSGLFCCLIWRGQWGRV